jgi:murein DD-endopeptidase MepM/ murein hydrolase activator NlpD
MPLRPRTFPVPASVLARGLGLLAALAAAPLAAHAAAPTLELHPTKVRPGSLITVTVRGAEATPTGDFAGRPLRFFAIDGGFRALAPLPSEWEPGQREVRVRVVGRPLVASKEAEPGEAAPRLAHASASADQAASADAQLGGAVEILPANFNVRELTVAGKYIEPPAKVKRRMEQDKKAFAKAFAQPWSPPLFSRRFAWPREDVITAPYGDLRTFNGAKQSQHYGTDIDGRVGDPVVAANDGVVVMARDNYAAGQTVILHHGAGLYTTYLHLSAISVQQGQKVERGQQLGKVGKTGRVTGPHLHWGVKVDGLYVDPTALLELELP